MENTWNFIPGTTVPTVTDSILRMARFAKRQSQSAAQPRLGEFKKITHADMPRIWEILKNEPGRTTDFSYGGLLMWVDYFNYEYTICQDTLFLKGVVESDLSKPAFSLPVGKLPLADAVDLIREYCQYHDIEMEFSAVPEYALDAMKALNPRMVEELKDWGDYLYPQEALTTLAGKKMCKKRNHTHQFVKNYPDWHAEPITPTNAHEAMEFMDIFDLEGDSSEMAKAERELSRRTIALMQEGDSVMEGMLLYADGKVCAYTIGDVKGDTLFVHIEKATRAANSSYEMINWVFANEMKKKHPEIEWINREDDSGDIGLRMAKESYHPSEILRKYNILF